MKKRISLGLAIMMVLSLLFYVNVFAAGDNELENAIKIAKSKIRIPAEYTVFNYSSGVEDVKVWRMDWSKKDGSGSISVGVSEKGNLVSYYKFDNTSGIYKKKLPKVSKQDAVAKAEAFIKSVNPEVLGQIKYMENSQSFTESVYVLNFVRMVNGIRFPDNYVGVNVNIETGEVQSYNQNWTEGITFPDSQKAIKKDAAQKFFKEKIGLEMLYRLKSEDEKYSTYPVYSPKLENAFIDALTGDKVILDLVYGFGTAGIYSKEAMYDIKLSNAVNQEAASLTPDEIKAIEQVSKILSKEVMEKKLREVKVLGLSDEFSVMNASMNKDYVDKDSVIWSFYFTKNNKDKVMQESVSVSADAKTGEIRNFWISDSKSPSGEPKFEKDASKAAVEEFLKEIQPDKFKNSEYFENSRVMPLITGNNEKPTEYNFLYRGIVNGIAFPSNQISATYDAVNGKISSYSMEWHDVKFSELDKVVPIEKVYESLFKDIGLELQYRSNYSSPIEMKMAGTGAGIKPEIKLVYALNDKKPAIFDAMTGKILTYEGKPYEEQKVPEYKDIKGHFAEKKIKILADFGIYFEGNQFNPDKKITQQDYMKLLYSILNYGNSMSPSMVTSKSQIEDMYNFLIREGVLIEKEKAPNSTVTREDSVKFLIRMLKYDKVADLKDIFKCNYKDKNKINKELVGYVVIGDALNLIHGTNGFFNPKNTLTRAEAMILTYNYLQI